MEKCCTKCKEIKPLEEFSKDKNKCDGLYSSCKVCCKQKNSTYYLTNRSKVRESQKDRHRRTYVKSARRLKTKEEKTIVRKACYKAWYANNPGRHKQRYESDLTFKLKAILRNRLRCAIKIDQKTGSAVRDLGCTIEELKAHLESLFQPGMTWDNWGKYGWHIDHIVPLSAFNLSDPVQFKQACHYTNLQPLWATDNLSKSNKLL